MRISDWSSDVCSSDLLAGQCLGADFGGADACRGFLHQFGLARFEHLDVGGGGRQRLALRQQVVAAEAGLDLDGLAEVAEILDLFEQKDRKSTRLNSSH